MAGLLLWSVLAGGPARAAGASEPSPMLEVSHVDELGKDSRSVVLRSVEYVLDGGPLAAEGGARREVSPGVHVLGVRVVYEGRSSLFGYLEGYRFVMQGRVTFEARPGHTLQVLSTGYVREGWTLRWQDRPGFRLEGRPQRDILRIENGPVDREPLAPAAVVDEALARAEASAPREPCQLEPVLFDFEDTRLTPEAREALARLSRCLLEQPSFSMRLVGHCDARGTESLNTNLGLGRALTVAGFLWSLGVSRERLEVETRGSEALACQERTEACYARSRRVELIPVAR